MRRYAVAKYLTDEQRQRVADATFVPTVVGNGCEIWCSSDPEVVTARTPEGYCPLGVALGRGYHVPDAEEVEYQLSKTGGNVRIRRAARRFIHDVDCGRLKTADVKAALGVTDAPTTTTKEQRP